MAKEKRHHINSICNHLRKMYSSFLRHFSESGYKCCTYDAFSPQQPPPPRKNVCKAVFSPDNGYIAVFIHREADFIVGLLLFYSQITPPPLLEGKMAKGKKHSIYSINDNTNAFSNGIWKCRKGLLMLFQKALKYGRRALKRLLKAEFQL